MQSLHFWKKFRKNHFSLIVFLQMCNWETFFYFQWFLATNFQLYILNYLVFIQSRFQNNEFFHVALEAEKMSNSKNFLRKLNVTPFLQYKINKILFKQIYFNKRK